MAPARHLPHRIALACAMALLLGTGAGAQYAVGDYGSIASGTWSGATTWGTWNGTAFTATAVGPGASNNVWVRNGHSVTITYGTVYNANNLTVESGGKLWTNNQNIGPPSENTYIQVYGATLRCDGVIGNGSTFDNICFAIEGATTTISGSGTFDCSRIRKNTNSPNSTTNLVIAIPTINIRFASSSTTQIYNNTAAASIFNVTINAGCTVNLVGTSGTGNLAIDGITGTGAANAGGTFTVNGTLNMNGILYLTTNNTANPCVVTISNGGLVRCNQIVAAAGAAPGMMTFNLNAGGRIEVQGTPTAWVAGFSNTNNTFTLATGGTFAYTGLGPQSVWCGIGGNYGNLEIGGSGTKSMDGLMTVRGNLNIVNTNGAPTLDCTASNFNMNVAGNWTNYNQTGFNERAALVALNGTAGQTINTLGGERYNNLRLSKLAGSIVTMQSDVAVGVQLNFVGGIIDLNQRRLTLENSAATAVIGGTAARYIISERTDHGSKVQWNIGTTTGAHLIPFGRSTGYLPFTFNLTAGNAGNVTVSTYGTLADNQPLPSTPTLVTNLDGFLGLSPDNSPATVDRFWQIDPTGPDPTATLTFTYLASELPAAPFNLPLQMESQRYDDVLDAWEPATPNQTPTAYTNTSPDITLFGPYTLAVNTSPLPVELLFFTAEQEGAAVRLDWSTASERDNAYFVVERSTDNILFEPIAQVEGAGTSLERIDYRAFDRTPLPGLNYYRLVQTDLDGTSTLNATISVRIQAGGTATPFHPNPASDRLILLVPEAGSRRYELWDTFGRLVHSFPPAAGPGQAVADVSGIAQGSYLLRESDGPGIWTLVIAR